MNQSSVIFGGLFIGFLIYVTIRGRLPAYAALFYQKGSGSGSGNPAATAPLVTNPFGTGISPITPGGTQVPNIGLTPLTPSLIPGLLPGA